MALSIFTIFVFCTLVKEMLLLLNCSRSHVLRQLPLEGSSVLYLLLSADFSFLMAHNLIKFIDKDL